jgi:hypothetical protein
VREYGLQRSEGVLLRYVNDCYKTLVQTVPERFRTEEVEDFADHLRATLRQVDSSLLDEWERMKNPEAAIAAKPVVELKPKELTEDPKAFAARVREELHRLLRALGQKRYLDALGILDNALGEWTAPKLEQAMAPYFEEHKIVVLTPQARKPANSTIKETGTRLWSAQQRIMDPEGHGDWMLDCEIDLRDRRIDDGPILILQRIGT